MRRGPHDQYFYRFPDKIISGKISAPRFLLDNQHLIRSHIHSLILETVEEKLPTKPLEIVEIKDGQDTFPLYPDLRQTFDGKITTHKLKIFNAVKEAFAGELREFSGWFTDEYITGVIDNFLDNLDHAFDPWRVEYKSLQDELREINRRHVAQRPSREESRRRDIIEQKMADMREGEKGFYVYRYLGSQGFLPNYAFPRLATQLIFNTNEDELSRDQVLALREYAPGNSVYYKGSRYQVVYSRPKTFQNLPVFEQLLVCDNCHTAYLGEETKRTVCAVCKSSFTSSHPNPYALEMPNMFALRRTNITADEEERMRLGYILETHYRKKGRVRAYEVTGKDGNRIIVSYEHNGRIITVNSGPVKTKKEGGMKGFNLCTLCNRWLLKEDGTEGHTDRNSNDCCPKNATTSDIAQGVELFSDSEHDVVIIDWPVPKNIDPDKIEDFYVTLLYTLQQGIQFTLNLDESEIDGFLAPFPGKGTVQRIVIYETGVGGEGAVASLTDKERLKQILKSARELLHEGEEGCQKACYECLCSFYNQIDHQKLDRNLVLPQLQLLEDFSITEVIPEGTGKSFEELEKKCESNFEREVLKTIRKKGLPLPADAQVVLRDGDIPIAECDFYYEPKIAVFVDGSPHYKDYIQAADEEKRRKLKAKGYRILAIKGDSLEEDLKKLGEWVG